MSRHARNLRVINRGWGNFAVIGRRNRKAAKQFDRWFSGRLVQKKRVLNVKGFYSVHWELQPTGRGLIHKGRKP